ncbi:MAG: aminotransferase class I/II-fold pyridoxal phosphate-dependent enzyme, partial [Methanomicrobium sp.]|nr:aminotransferase class I/II-fold pyridoxal phosphate-dependent enzyme [Methanomicrobium sp.]
VEKMRQEFDRRRIYLTGALNGLGFKTAPADGAFYAFLKVDDDDMKVCGEWLEEALVAATPGSAFNSPGWVRISYAAGLDTLKEAVRRIENII